MWGIWNWKQICLWLGFPGSLAGKESIRLQCRRLQFNSWVQKIPWRKDRLSTPVLLGFPGGSYGKECTCNAGDLGLIPGLGRSLGEGNGNLLQYSGLENSMDRKAWWTTVQGIAKSRTGYSPWGHKESDMTEQLSLLLFTFMHLIALKPFFCFKPSDHQQKVSVN